MSSNNDVGSSPAFPLPSGTERIKDWHPGHGEFSRQVNVAWSGMTKLEVFSLGALQGILANPHWNNASLLAVGIRPSEAQTVAARMAVLQAEVLIAVLGDVNTSRMKQKGSSDGD